MELNGDILSHLVDVIEPMLSSEWSVLSSNITQLAINYHYRICDGHTKNEEQETEWFSTSKTPTKGQLKPFQDAVFNKQIYQ